MKITACANPDALRAGCLTIVAENEVEEVVLYQFLLKLRSEPPHLPQWYQEVLDVIESGSHSNQDISEKCGVEVTAMSNRLQRLWKMGLLDRRAVPCKGRFYSYTLRRRKEGEPEGFRLLEGL